MSLADAADSGTDVRARVDDARVQETYVEDVTRAFVIAMCFWGIVAFAAGVYIALQLAFPMLNLGLEWTTFGRLLRLRAPEVATTLDDLEAQHREGQGRLAHLKQALAEYRSCTEAPAEAGTRARQDRGGSRCLTAAAAFLDSVETYATFHWKHMRIEEDVVLRLAEKTFDDADWSELETAFSSHRDPLHGVGANGEDFRALFTRIVNLAPAPIGLGPALDAA